MMTNWKRLLNYVCKNKRSETNQFKIGFKLVDTATPEGPLPLENRTNIFAASAYQKEQKQSRADIKCGYCKEQGHIKQEGTNQSVCNARSMPNAMAWKRR